MQRQLSRVSAFALVALSLFVAPSLNPSAHARAKAAPKRAGAARHADGVPPSRLARLRRGINLSHWFAQAPRGDYSEAHLKSHTTGRDLALIRELGFDHVRFTVEPAPLFDPAVPSRLKAEHLRHLDAALDLLLASGLAVIFDLHPADEFKHRLKDDRAVAAFEEFWRSLARHLSRRDPERLFLEILNEPVIEDAYRWMGIQARVAAAVREGAPRHTIVAAGPRWSSVDELLRIEPVADPNVIYNFHFYEPHTFTHQGATWGADFWPHLKNIPYPSSPETIAPLLAGVGNQTARGALKDYGDERWDAARVEREIARAAEWGRRRGVPLMCNEFGVYRAYTPTEARLRWIEDVRRALERHHVGWTMWDYAGSFAVVLKKEGRATPDPATLAALGLRPRRGTGRRAARSALR
ncbi:MAG TPA: cellulase family glycosylhydrolase [Pyrinomonadaceae bacterium]|nr:cellulase family glycosylhydrolase [Pyrinomonadaceae bacterium]